MSSKDKTSATCQIMTGSGYKEYQLNVVQLQGVGAVGDFIGIFSCQDFLSGMGFAITHSKVIVITPFGKPRAVAIWIWSIETFLPA